MQELNAQKERVEVCKGGDSPKPPQDRGGVCVSQIVVAAPDRTMCSQALRVINDWGEPVSKRATQPNWADVRPLWILILVVNVERSIETIPEGQGTVSVQRGVGRYVPYALLMSSLRGRRHRGPVANSARRPNNQRAR